MAKAKPPTSPGKAKKTAKPAKPIKPKLIRGVADAVARTPQTAHVLDRLYAVIETRRNADPALSHSARLLARGRAKVAQKFGEEAVEAVIEGAAGTAHALVAESADLLYHLLLMWVASGVEAEAVWAELARREGVSGILEKASRPLPRDLATRKIP